MQMQSPKIFPTIGFLSIPGGMLTMTMGTQNHTRCISKMCLKQVGLIFPGTLKKLKLDTSLEFGAHWSSSFSSKHLIESLVDNGHVAVKTQKVGLSVYQ